jgi:hypothetical protein
MILTLDESRIASNTDWLRTVDRLGGAEEEAWEFGAFQRARKVKCAVDHLRLVLAYYWSRSGWSTPRRLRRPLGPGAKPAAGGVSIRSLIWRTNVSPPLN